MMLPLDVPSLQAGPVPTPPSTPLPFFIALVGPTGIGKSAIAEDLAKVIDGEIVALDSMQIYRYLDIGTAKPTLAEQDGIPHHLISLVDPNEAFSATDYARLVHRVLKEIHSRGRLPVVVGGSGLYLRALRGEIFAGPREVKSIRTRLGQEAKYGGPEVLHARLARLDPLAADRIHPRDLFRLVRALEIIEVTGRRVTDLWEVHRRGLVRPASLLLGLHRERTDLYGRINDRVDRMIESGLIGEVKKLLAAGYSPHIKPFRSHNYRYIVAFLLGEKSLEEATKLTKQETRHYAKRQMTWFRRETDITWFDLMHVESSTVREVLIQQIQRARERHGAS
jgi:tRNA dimethylallyltransferase